MLVMNQASAWEGKKSQSQAITHLWEAGNGKLRPEGKLVNVSFMLIIQRV